MLELAVGFLGVWVLKKGFGPVDRTVDARLDSLWKRVAARLGPVGPGHDALERLKESPKDPEVRSEVEEQLAAAVQAEPEFEREIGEWLQTVDVAVQAAWIAADTGVALTQVDRVLDVEAEYMEGVGITQGFRENFIYYRREDLAALTRDGEPELDVSKIGSDAARFLGLPVDLAVEVLESETRYLQLRGIAGPDIENAVGSGRSPGHME